MATKTDTKKKVIVDEHHCKLIIKNLPNMNKKDIKRTASWLRACAVQVETDATAYAKNATFKLMK